MATAVQDPTTTNGDGYEDEPEGLYTVSPRQLSFDVGGEKPTDSTLKVVGGQIEVRGSFQKGERIRATIELTVGEVSFRDKRDSKTDEVVGCTRAHKARITGFERE
jgi:hypothetical protein